MWNSLVLPTWDAKFSSSQISDAMNVSRNLQEIASIIHNEFSTSFGLKNKRNLVNCRYVRLVLRGHRGNILLFPEGVPSRFFNCATNARRAPPPRQLLTILLIRPLYSLSLVRWEKNGTIPGQDLVRRDYNFIPDNIPLITPGPENNECERKR